MQNLAIVPWGIEICNEKKNGSGTPCHKFSSVVEEHSRASYRRNCSTHSLRTSDNISNEYKYIIFSWLKLTANSIRNKLPNKTRLIYQPPIYHRETIDSSLSRGNGFVTFVLLHKLDTSVTKVRSKPLSNNTNMTVTSIPLGYLSLHVVF